MEVAAGLTNYKLSMERRSLERRHGQNKDGQ
jgi:hypothetical protein